MRLIDLLLPLAIPINIRISDFGVKMKKKVIYFFEKNNLSLLNFNQTAIQSSLLCEIIKKSAWMVDLNTSVYGVYHYMI